MLAQLSAIHALMMLERPNISSSAPMSHGQGFYLHMELPDTKDWWSLHLS